MKNPVPLILIAAALVTTLVVTHRKDRSAGICLAPPAPLESPASAPPPAVGSTFHPAPEAVVAAAVPQGRTIASETFSLLSSNLLQAISKGGVSNALAYCSLKALPLTESAASRHQVQIARVTHKPRNPQHRADATELALLEAWRSDLQRGGGPLGPVVLTNAAGMVRFYSAIVITNPLCLNCHGTPGLELLPANHAFIRRLYPEDEAIGFRLGDLRGLWRIDFRLDDLVEARK